MIGTSPGRSNRIFRGCPGVLEGDIVGTSWGPIFAGWDDLDYHAVEFPLRGKDFSKIEEKKNIWINVLGYENRLTFSDLRFGSKI